MCPENHNLHQRLCQTKVIAVDVDGTLTDGGMYYFGESGEAKKFNVRDGAGIVLLKRAGIKILIVSGESHSSIERRARKLQVDACFTGIRDKVTTVGNWLEANSLSWNETACVCDEINDLPLVRKSQVSFAANDGSELVLREVDVVLQTPGGHGVLREVADRVLRAQGTLDTALNRYLDGLTPKKDSPHDE